MNKIMLIIEREFMTRVKKKSFLLATILTPLLFPTVIGGIMYLAFRDTDSAEKKTIEIYDPHQILEVENNSRFDFVEVEGDSSQRVSTFLEGNSYAHIEVSSGSNLRYSTYTKSGLTFIEQDRIEDALEEVIRQNRLDSLNIDKSTLDALRPNVNLSVYNIKENKDGGSAVTYVVGYVSGFLIYMFLFIYGAQVMQGVLEEKTNKIVEILVATVRPFQLMMGKVIGIGSVGLLQFVLWVVLMATLTTVIFGVFGIDMSQASPMASAGSAAVEEMGTGQEIANILSGIPFLTIILTFIFYFLGGYFLYGALFAAVGSAVDSPAEAQQFMLPITIPLIASIIGLSGVMMNPDGSLAFWLSIIPFTSPVAMMGRIGFGMPPVWELVLSMTLLVLGFIGSIWVAGRIYRIGILMHGTKVNWKVLARWFVSKQ